MQDGQIDGEQGHIGRLKRAMCSLDDETCVSSWKSVCMLCVSWNSGMGLQSFWEGIVRVRTHLVLPALNGSGLEFMHFDFFSPLLCLKTSSCSKPVWVYFFCWAQYKIFWRMLVTKLLMVAIEFHSMEKNIMDVNGYRQLISEVQWSISSKN